MRDRRFLTAGWGAAGIAAALSCACVAAAALLTSAAALGGDSTAAEVDAFLEAWAQKSSGIRSLAIRFRQEKRLRILRRPRASEGDLAYADGRLSVVVRGQGGEVESELLLRDGELKILYPRLRRLEVIEVGKGASGPGGAMGPSIPFFAGDPRDARRDYEVQLSRGEKGDALTLAPKDARSPVKRLELILVDFEVREYRQVEVNGDELHFEIVRAEVNAKVPPERFELRLPEGTVVVRPAGAARAEGGLGAKPDRKAEPGSGEKPGEKSGEKREERQEEDQEKRPQAEPRQPRSQPPG